MDPHSPTPRSHTHAHTKSEKKKKMLKRKMLLQKIYETELLFFDTIHLLAIYKCDMFRTQRLHLLTREITNKIRIFISICNMPILSPLAYEVHKTCNDKLHQGQITQKDSKSGSGISCM